MQGSSMSDISMMREKMQMMQSFQSGKTNLSQDDLTAIQSDLSSQGIQEASSIDELIENFSEIDTNGDGISVDELNTYTGGQGMSIMGPPPGLFDGGGQGPPPPPKAEGSSSSESSSTSSDYIDSLLESLYGEDEESETTSYFA